MARRLRCHNWRSNVKQPVLLLLAVTGVACAAPARNDADVVRDALRAQVSGPGGCRGMDAPSVSSYRFFPGVRFYRGLCAREHGDTVGAIVGIDTATVPFLLSSLGAFRFLRLRHPPVGVDSSTAVEYAFSALVFSGELGAQAALVQKREDVPAANLAAAGVKRDELLISGVQSFSHGVRIVWVTAWTQGDFFTFGTSVDDASGEVVIIQRPGDR